MSQNYPHSIIYPFAGRIAGNPEAKGSGLCEKCGMGEQYLTGSWKHCFLAERPGEDRKRHRKAFEQGR